MILNGPQSIANIALIQLGAICPPFAARAMRRFFPCYNRHAGEGSWRPSKMRSHLNSEVPHI
ncbi:MAG TPA: hypothetical protein DCK99_00900 [Blastocatellia bacterium]|nr:hypothetical protein [Blastocatellia bacterium]